MVTRSGADMKNNGIRLGVIGCGQFARFAVEQFIDVPGTRVTAVTDVVEASAVGTAERFGAVVADDPGALATRADVDLVYVATPPALHHPLAMLALEAGKHVIVEKPLALALHQADEMIETARRRNLLIVANLMQRYGELVRALFADQLAWIRDPRHRRTVAVDNGRSSLLMAINADRLSHHCAVMSRTMCRQRVQFPETTPVLSGRRMSAAV